MKSRNAALNTAGWILIGISILGMVAFSIRILFAGLTRLTGVLQMLIGIFLPLLAGLYLANRSTELAEERSAQTRRLMMTAFCFYIWVLLCMFFLSRIQYRGFFDARRNYYSNLRQMTNYVPFKTIRLYIRALQHHYVETGIPLANLFGNLILFVPMAVFLPMLFPSMRRFWVWLLTMAGILLAVEGLQLLLACGTCDVDDLLLNLSGALIGYGIYSIPFTRRTLTRLFRSGDNPLPDNNNAADNSEAELSESSHI